MSSNGSSVSEKKKKKHKKSRTQGEPKEKSQNSVKDASMQLEMCQAAVFNNSGSLIESTFDVSGEDVDKWVHLFDDEEDAFRQGVDVGEEHSDIHRWYGDRYICGRRGQGKELVGVAIVKLCKPESQILFTIGVFEFPMLAARAVPILEAFSKSHLSPMLE